MRIIVRTAPARPVRATVAPEAAPGGGTGGEQAELIAAMMRSDIRQQFRVLPQKAATDELTLAFVLVSSEA